MRIGVVSDTHGYIERAIKSLKSITGLDLIIHLGDHVSDAKNIEEEMNLEVIYVRGNCDLLDVDVDEEKVLEMEGKKIFITHGHIYDVKNGITKLFFKGKEINADIILFGHSHMSTKLIHENMLIFNPGSPNDPRSGSKASIGLVELFDGDIKSKIIEI